jgi:hypothetical protein
VNPKDRITAYLSAHKSTIESFSNVDKVVKDVKVSVFYGMSPISDDEIRTIVVQWAMFYAPGLLIAQPAAGPPAPTPGSSSGNPDSDLVDAVKKAVTTINDGVTIGDKDANNINIGVTGLTANLKSSSSEASLGISWSGTLKLEAANGPFHFEGTLAKDKWEISLSFPSDTYIPDLSTLGKVFSEGEKSIGKMADATRSFNNISDVGKVGALIKPNVSAVQDAVDAVSGIAKAPKKGGMSFGFKIGSPDPGPGQQGMPGGVQGQVVFTYVF